MDLQPALQLVDSEQGRLWLVEPQQLWMELDTFRVRGARYHQCSTSQIHFTNFDKYILQFWQIYFTIWTNIFYNLDKYICICDKYIVDGVNRGECNQQLCWAAPIYTHCTVSDHSDNECLWMDFVIRLSLKLRNIDVEKFCDDRFLLIFAVLCHFNPLSFELVPKIGPPPFGWLQPFGLCNCLYPIWTVCCHLEYGHLHCEYCRHLDCMYT